MRLQGAQRVIRVRCWASCLLQSFWRNPGIFRSCAHAVRISRLRVFNGKTNTVGLYTWTFVFLPLGFLVPIHSNMVQAHVGLEPCSVDYRMSQDALRVFPAEARLTVYRRRQVAGSWLREDRFFFYRLVFSALRVRRVVTRLTVLHTLSI